MATPEDQAQQHEMCMAHDGPQCNSQDLHELDERNKVRQFQRLSGRLFEHLIGFVFILPLFVVNLHR